MKYIISEYPERYYIGLIRECNLKHIEDMCIGELWTTFFSKYDSLHHEPGALIGLEVYPSDFETTRKFNYYAAAPSKKDFDVEGMEKVTIPKGKYVRVEITVQNLFDGVTPKVYEFLATTDLEIDYGFDYEEYPEGIDMSNVDSLMYIVLKLK